MVAKVNVDCTVSSMICVQTGSILDVSKMLLKSYSTEDTLNRLICNSEMFLVAPGFTISSNTFKSFDSEKDMRKSINKDIDFIYLFKNEIWYFDTLELTKIVQDN